MGVAAYYRGNRSISRGICGNCGRCSACYEPPTPEPRPPGWGGKIRAKADKRAAGLVRWFARDGRTLGVEDLAYMVRDDVGCGVKTSTEAATAALNTQRTT
jgi:hypothetical protein